MELPEISISTYDKETNTLISKIYLKFNKQQSIGFGRSSWIQNIKNYDMLEQYINIDEKSIKVPIIPKEYCTGKLGSGIDLFPLKIDGEKSTLRINNCFGNRNSLAYTAEVKVLSRFDIEHEEDVEVKEKRLKLMKKKRKK